VEFLTEHGSEVENILLHEWNMQEALEVRYEEGVAIGDARTLSRVKELVKSSLSGEELLERLEKR